MLTLLSMLGGGLLRFLPELIALFTRKQDNSHELNMLDRQIQLETLHGSNTRQEISLTGDINEALAALEASSEAVKSQMQLTGIRFVDALNFLVRPLTTYYMLILYGIAKGALFVLAWHNGVDLWSAMANIYGEDDKQILSGILAFWFVGRVFDKKK